MTKPKTAPHNSALIVAAGSGSRARRASDNTAKQYIPLAGKSVLAWTLTPFLNHPQIHQVQVVIAKDDKDLYEEAIDSLFQETTSRENAEKKLLPPAIGGDTRQVSVRHGLDALEDIASNKPDNVLIHDAARPYITQTAITNCIKSLRDQKATLLATAISDTAKRSDDKGQILTTIDRTNLWAAQTPQNFHFDFIRIAHRNAADQGITALTDDAAIAEWAGETVHIVEGERTNIKLTTQEDLDMAEQSLPTQSAPLTDIRMGTGYDVHAFDEGDAVIIGGISIPHSKKLKGHSDADVGLHAITDAILGAIADGDIGTHFPPSDPQWKGAASDLFLKDAVRRVTDLGGKISNIDLTLICEEPKIGPHRPAIREEIAKICDLPISRISVKATTSERLGFTGRKEGIAALASTCVKLPETE